MNFAVRLAFDLTTGEQSQLVDLPGQSTLLGGPQQLIVVHDSQLNVDWDGQRLREVTLQTHISPKDYQRLAQASVAGIPVPEAGALEDNLFLQIELRADLDKLAPALQSIDSGDESFDILALRDNDYPIFFKLTNYIFLKATQVTRSIEER